MLIARGVPTADAEDRAKKAAARLPITKLVEQLTSETDADKVWRSIVDLAKNKTTDSCWKAS